MGSLLFNYRGSFFAGVSGVFQEGLQYLGVPPGNYRGVPENKPANRFDSVFSDALTYSLARLESHFTLYFCAVLQKISIARTLYTLFLPSEERLDRASCKAR